MTQSIPRKQATRRATAAPPMRRSPARPGATLTEVLMSILVMGIGVLSAIALFPISFLRTVQATNLTNATIARFDAEAAIGTDVQNRLIAYQNWQPGIAVAVDDTVVAVTQRNEFRYRCTAGGNTVAPEPAWPLVIGTPVTEAGGPTWVCEACTYVIDPIGAQLMTAALKLKLGNDGAGPAAPAGNIDRFDGFNGAGTLDLARALATLPDSWVFQAESALPGPVVGGATSFAFPPEIELSGVPDPSVATNPSTRVILTDPATRRSETRLLTAVSAPPGPFTVTWIDALPAAGFGPTVARLDTQERRYTWLLSVRRKADTTANVAQYEVDVVTFFRRTFEDKDERIFDVNQSGARDYQVTIPGGVDIPFKKGGFAFDSDNGRWYRIQNVQGTTISIDRGAVVPMTHAIFMRGVVDVFPIGTFPRS